MRLACKPLDRMREIDSISAESMLDYIFVLDSNSVNSTAIYGLSNALSTACMPFSFPMRHGISVKSTAVYCISNALSTACMPFLYPRAMV